MGRHRFSSPVTVQGPGTGEFRFDVVVETEFLPSEIPPMMDGVIAAGARNALQHIMVKMMGKK